MASESNKSPKSNEKIIAEFQTLRNEQRNLAQSIAKMQEDLKEHKTVIDTLKNVAEDRKCYRMFAGVLCARTVKEILPDLNSQKDHLETMITKYNEQLSNKGVEINKYIEDNNIKIKGQHEPIPDKVESPSPLPVTNDEENRNRILVTN